jgi:hypothetical protein
VTEFRRLHLATEAVCTFIITHSKDADTTAMKPNTKFNLSVEDIAMIENALLHYQVNHCTEDKKNVQELLAKIYHQKVWYRPKKDYVSG